MAVSSLPALRWGQCLEAGKGSRSLGPQQPCSNWYQADEPGVLHLGDLLLLGCAGQRGESPFAGCILQENDVPCPKSSFTGVPTQNKAWKTQAGLKTPKPAKSHSRRATATSPPQNHPSLQKQGKPETMSQSRDVTVKREHDSSLCCDIFGGTLEQYKNVRKRLRICIGFQPLDWWHWQLTNYAKCNVPI